MTGPHPTSGAAAAGDVAVTGGQAVAALSQLWTAVVDHTDGGPALGTPLNEALTAAEVARLALKRALAADQAARTTTTEGGEGSALYRAAYSALRFAGSRNAISADHEKAILALVAASPRLTTPAVASAEVRETDVRALREWSKAHDRPMRSGLFSVPPGLLPALDRILAALPPTETPDEAILAPLNGLRFSEMVEHFQETGGLEDVGFRPDLDAATQPTTGDGSAGEKADLALNRAVRFTAYNRDDPLAIRFEFASEDDRLEAADEIDTILSDAFAAARARMADVLTQAREERGGKPIKVRRRSDGFQTGWVAYAAWAEAKGANLPLEEGGEMEAARALASHAVETPPGVGEDRV